MGGKSGSIILPQGRPAHGGSHEPGHAAPPLHEPLTANVSAPSASFLGGDSPVRRIASSPGNKPPRCRSSSVPALVSGHRFALLDHPAFRPLSLKCGYAVFPVQEKFVADTAENHPRPRGVVAGKLAGNHTRLTGLIDSLETLNPIPGLGQTNPVWRIKIQVTVGIPRIAKRVRMRSVFMVLTILWCHECNRSLQSAPVRTGVF
jgi:hypothetical protein